jgi:hypothetical protein
MAQHFAGSSVRELPTVSDQPGTCAVCAGTATQQTASDAGSFGDPDVNGERAWTQYPPIDTCDSCLTLLIRERISVGWCALGAHWGPEYVECQLHLSWFDRPII